MIRTQSDGETALTEELLISDWSWLITFTFKKIIEQMSFSTTDGLNGNNMDVWFTFETKWSQLWDMLYYYAQSNSSHI